MPQPPYRSVKKGGELLILSLIEHQARHGYEINKLIEVEHPHVRCCVVSSILYHLEQRNLGAGRCRVEALAPADNTS